VNHLVQGVGKLPTKQLRKKVLGEWGEMLRVRCQRGLMATTTTSPCSHAPRTLWRRGTAPRGRHLGNPGPRGKDEFQTVTV